MRRACAGRMIARRYQELDCWSLANELKLRIYAFIATPPASKDFQYCDQIRNSARGATRTIAEGFGRFRPGDFARYLEFARASLIETQNHLGDGFDSGYLSAQDRDRWSHSRPARSAPRHGFISISTTPKRRRGAEPRTANPEPSLEP